MKALESLVIYYMRLESQNATATQSHKIARPKFSTKAVMPKAEAHSRVPHFLPMGRRGVARHRRYPSSANSTQDAISHRIKCAMWRSAIASAYNNPRPQRNQMTTLTRSVSNESRNTMTRRAVVDRGSTPLEHSRME